MDFQNLTAIAQTSPSHIVAQAQAAYDKGDYQKAEQLLLSVAEQSLDTDEVDEWFILQARIHFAFDRRTEMQMMLNRLYHFDPDFKLDPLKDPPLMHEYWQTLKQKNPKKVKSLLEEQKQITSNQDHNTDPPQPKKTPNKPTPPWDGFYDDEQKLRQNSKFWFSLLPFGVGHFNSDRYQRGFMFLGSEIAVLYAAQQLAAKESALKRRYRKDHRYLGVETEDKGYNYHSNVFGTFAFLGFWGYELNSLMPELYDYNEENAGWTRYALSFFPFGVGQIKNHQITKGIGFALTESFMIALATLYDNSNVRNYALTGFIAAWIYGAYDGWANHKWDQQPAQSAGNQFHLNIIPMMTDYTSQQLALKKGILIDLQFRFN